MKAIQFLPITLLQTSLLYGNMHYGAKVIREKPGNVLHDYNGLNLYAVWTLGLELYVRWLV